jgi:hypothetical protein
MNDSQLLKHLAINGNCNGTDTDVFFEPDDSRNVLRQNMTAIQKICGACAVRNDCLDYALRHDVSGVWGGMNHAERKRLRKELGIKAEPVSFQLYVLKLKSHHHEDLLWRYIDSRDSCIHGHPISSPRDVIVSYDKTTNEPAFRCKECNDASGKRYRKKAAALSTEPSRG